MFDLGMPKSVSGHAAHDISVSIERVFDFVAENFFENYPRWCPQVVEVIPLDSDVVHIGARARQTTLENGVQTTSTFEVSKLDPPSAFEISGISDHFRGVYKFSKKNSNETTIFFQFEFQEIDFAMRPFRKLIERALKEGAQATIQNIASLLEQHETESGAKRSSLS
ncbi:MAG: SRPBCC family protein [Methylocystis sp.]|uniref:SRPBCC family protein n=1 Tax=Methylocystis sp. TaxID=1911079 RepID=UPI003D135025